MSNLGRWEKHELDKSACVYFNTLVTSVRFCEESDKFLVEARYLKTYQ